MPSLKPTEQQDRFESCHCCCVTKPSCVCAVCSSADLVEYLVHETYTPPTLRKFTPPPTTAFPLPTAFADQVYLVMSRTRVSSTSMGSSYRHLLVRSEWWRVVTAAVAHGGLLHLAFNIISLWSCRCGVGKFDFLRLDRHLRTLTLSRGLYHVWCFRLCTCRRFF